MTMAFDELMTYCKATIAERQECVYFLAQYRARKTIETLLPIRVEFSTPPEPTKADR